MNILLDHCIDWRLRRFLPTHNVKTTREMGWDTLKNGKLLTAATTVPFDVFLTVDQNIKSEQNLSTLPISIVVLAAEAASPVVRFPAF